MTTKLEPVLTGGRVDMPEVTRVKVKTIKTCPKVVKVGDTYFGNAWKESPVFALDNNFLDKYKDLKPNFGFNGLGELVFYRTYSRSKETGGKESFFDVVKRCVEGCYEIQRRHCMKLHIPWDYEKAQESAQEMFERMFTFKFLPPGRGLWVMGTEFMYQKGSAALNNCGMISTDINIHTDIAEPFAFMLDMEMLGVGVGFDTRGKSEIEISQPNPNKYVEYIIEDSREGWVDSLRTLIHSYGKKSHNGEVIFNYENIRPEGSPIKGFGGTAAGPDILRELHQLTRNHLESCMGSTLSSGDIVDLMNYIGKCVVAGNVRRTAQIAFGELDDMEYVTLKNAYHNLDTELTDLIRSKEGMAWERYNTTKEPFEVTDSDGNIKIVWKQVPPYLKFEDFEVLPEGDKLEKFKRAIHTWNSLSRHRWASNNSIFAEVGMDYTRFMDSVKNNGEPGFLWLDNCKNYGRMVDGYQEGIDGLAVGSNPCSEQTLENSELCCLVETFPSRHDNVEDYHRTLKFAFLYAKTVTLLPTHSARTNAVMLRNRRIGLSQSGIVQAFSKFGRRAVLRDFCDAGYQVIKKWDNIYSKWLCITPSIKVTSVKPSGTVSLLAGVSPGIHYPEAQHYWRRVRINKHHQLAKICADAGYHIEPAASDPENTVVIKFAISDASVKPTDQVSIYQQVANVVDYQRYWADNQVSVTIKVKQEEKEDIINVLESYEDQLKSISFMTLEGHGYVQAPYEPCTEEEVIEYNKCLKPLDFGSYIEPEEGSKFCDGDSCSV